MLHRSLAVRGLKNLICDFFQCCFCTVMSSEAAFIIFNIEALINGMTQTVL